MSATLLEQPRVGRRRKADAAEPLNGIDADTSAPRATATRKRNRDRLARDAIDIEPEHFVVEESHHEGVWLDGPLALTLLPPLGSFLTGGTYIRKVLC